MTPPAPSSEDDFVAGWLLAWKATAAAGADLPDPEALDAPPELKGRLRRGAECLRRLHAHWPADRRAREPAAVDPAPERPEPDLGAASVLTGRFTVRGELGRGGFGVVYRARDAVLNRDVALKVPLPGALAHPAERRFTLEAEAAARLSHPNIVAVYDAGPGGAIPFIASEYCPGTSLADWLRAATGPVPWRDAAALVGVLADAVQHAHSRGVLHRDLKPANILLTAADPGPGPRPLPAYVPKVTDFGMAKFLFGCDGSGTVSGVIRGTPAYMAPEQAGGRGEDVTTAADVYALGAILYELLTRRPPFAADTPLATLELARIAPVARPRSVRLDIPADLETVCLKCLEKDPHRRYLSAGAMAEDLNRVLRGEPIQARRATAAERFARVVRRYPAASGLAAALLAALVVGLGVTAHLLGQARRERDRAEQNFEELLTAYDDVARAAINRRELRTADLRPYWDELLEKSADQLRAVAARVGDGPRGRPLRALCHLRLSDIAYWLGHTGESKAHARLAADEYERAARDAPGDTALRHGVALALFNLARAEEHGPERDRLVDRALAAYASVGWGTTDAAREQGLVLATILYDLAVIANARSDADAARRFLKLSEDELGRDGGTPDVRRGRAHQHSHHLQFRCQVERFHGRPADAVRAGRAALDAAAAACRDWPDDYQSWTELAGSYVEYGLALEQADQRDQAVILWEKGYDVLGGGEAARAARPAASHLADLCNGRLMLAYNLGLGYDRMGRAGDSHDWFERARDLGQKLLLVRPNDRLVLYEYGMSCVNIVEYSGGTRRPVDSLHLLGEGVASLEKALALTPADHPLRSDVGVCWHRYADALHAAGKPADARSAIRTAVWRQTEICLAAPSADHACRLCSHAARFVELQARGLLGPTTPSAAAKRGP